MVVRRLFSESVVVHFTLVPVAQVCQSIETGSTEEKVSLHTCPVFGVPPLVHVALHQEDQSALSSFLNKLSGLLFHSLICSFKFPVQPQDQSFLRLTSEFVHGAKHVTLSVSLWPA